MAITTIRLLGRRRAEKMMEMAIGNGFAPFAPPGFARLGVY